ncbi:hypothetical protein ALC53_07617 [Atta colombica]|uniref:Uncharacterized protein n=1 Tax=Atta colombica TaxID=520822 RepID=A0A151I2R7_9HYME|nr:hypothetical protein ALC53_07617 [Atta colombica]
MSFLHTYSSKCIKNELSSLYLLRKPALIDSQWIYYKPVTSLADDSLIEFVVPGHGEDYLDFCLMESKTISKICILDASLFVKKFFEKRASLYVEAYHTLFSETDIHFCIIYAEFDNVLEIDSSRHCRLFRPIFYFNFLVL